jgi:hypothetical protein
MKARKAVPVRRPGRGVLVRINPDGLRAMRQLALDRDTTLQALAVEAFNVLLRKHRRPGVVVTPQGRG